MAVVLVVVLVLVVLDADEVVMHGGGIEAQGDERVERDGDGDGLGEQPRGPPLLVLELQHVVVAPDHLVPRVLARAEKPGQGEPLPGDLVPVVGVAELVVADAVSPGCSASRGRSRGGTSRGRRMSSRSACRWGLRGSDLVGSGGRVVRRRALSASTRSLIRGRPSSSWTWCVLVWRGVTRP